MSRRDRVQPRRKFRCAVYTRKSSDEGLEQSFNSLHAQRDACEAFVASQKHEGWNLLPDAYDDGGLSGGSLERPALLRLLDDVRNGHVDIVVVYKVDRLTRSLADFAKLTELFDQHEASFVSVTQAFNTSTSMGRLTLNVLLSFAQFEREVAGERIRDKIALSKKRGMWMGGLPPLGYDGVDGKLVINEAEAENVRLIYRRYLEVGSVATLRRSLNADDIVSKRRTFQDGRRAGGNPFSRGALYQILRNRLDRGEIAHRGEIHDGIHDDIIDEDLWNKVQSRLAEHSSRSRGTGNFAGSAAPLGGLLFDTHGNRLTPTYAVKAGRRYRYYTSACLVRGDDRAKGIRVPAADLENLIAETIAEHLVDPIWIAKIAGDADLQALTRIIDAAAKVGRTHDQNDTDAIDLSRLTNLIEKINVATSGVVIALNRSHLIEALEAVLEGPALPFRDNDAPIEIVTSAQLQRRGKQIRLIIGEVETDDRKPDSELVQLIRDGHRWFEDLRTGRAATISQIAKRDCEQVSHVSRTISLAFMAPDIVKMILAGRQPITLTPEQLKAARPLPLEWSEQRTFLLG